MKYSKFFKLIEKKDHLINKLNLTDDQKKSAIDFFTKHPNYESEIDWNRKDLTWEDFEKVINKERVSKKKIDNYVKEDRDYKVLFKNDKVTVYQPLTYHASRYLASKEVAPYVEGKWCIAYQKERKYWDDYTFGEQTGSNTVFLIVCTESTKYAIEIAVDDFEKASSYDEVAEGVYESLNTLIDERVDYLRDANYDYLYREFKELHYDGTGDFNLEDYDDEWEEYLSEFETDRYSEVSSDIYDEYFDDTLCNNLFAETNIWDDEDRDEYLANENSPLRHYDFPLTIQQTYELILEAVKNFPLIEKLHDRDLEISEELEKNRREEAIKAFLQEQKECQEKGVDFVYDNVIGSDLSKDISLGLITLLENASYDDIIDGLNVKFDVVEDDINLNNANLISLKNFPKKVEGSVFLRNTLLKSLEGSPEYVGYWFDVSDSFIENLKGSPSYVGRDFDCSYTSIKNAEDLMGAPKYIGGNFYCRRNGLYENDILEVLKKNGTELKGVVYC